MKIIKGMGKLLSRLAGYFAALWRQRQRLNQWMARRYTSAMLALIGTLVCLAVALYLPAVYLVLKAGLERVRYFSEAVAVTALGVLIFADISYLAPVPSAADGRRGVRKNVQGLQPLRRRPRQRAHCGRPGIRGLRADRLSGRVKEKPPYTKPERPCGMLRLS